MAILQAVLALVFKQAGRLLNTAFGWATILLFGKVPEKRQLYLSVVTFGSVIWLVVVLGIAFPRVGAFLLAFVPLPDWVGPNWVRLIMLAAAVVLPAVVGFVSLFLLDPEDRPKGIGAKLKAVLKGYPYTLGLALTLIMMLVIAPIMKARDLIKRWTSTHVPVVVEPTDYLDVVSAVQQVLRAGGFETTRTPAGPMLRWPTKVLAFFAGGAIANLVADELTVLKSPRLEVLLHPSDLVIRGREEGVARAHALITEHLTFTEAYLTWTKEAQEMEDRLRTLWHQVRSGGAGVDASDGLDKLRAFDRDLKKLKVTYEEWEVLFREKLLVERALLRAVAGIADGSEDATDAGMGAELTTAARPVVRSGFVTATAMALAFLALLKRTFGQPRQPLPR